MTDGFIIINKSPGMSSYDIIKRLKKIETFKKIGYIGTLDRNATGVLPVAVNEGVKIIPFLENGIKKYLGRFILGITTDTFDMEGTRLTEVDAPVFDLTVLVETLATFKGVISQKVPLYSSKKMGGKPLYKWVREGFSPETPHKEVEVYDIVLLGYDHPYIDVEVTCSKGTYIRVIAHDFGAIIGCGAALYSLKRTQHGEFTLDKSIPIEDMKTKEDIARNLVSLEEILPATKGLTIDPVFERFIRNGMPVPLMGGSKDWTQGELAKLFSREGILLGIGRVDTDSKTIKMKRLINSQGGV
jgi:tRNA pseudouridine55 synthase